MEKQKRKWNYGPEKVIKSVAFIKFYLQAFIASLDLKAFYDTSIMVEAWKKLQIIRYYYKET